MFISTEIFEMYLMILVICLWVMFSWCIARARCKTFRFVCIQIKEPDRLKEQSLVEAALLHYFFHWPLWQRLRVKINSLNSESFRVEFLSLIPTIKLFSLATTSMISRCNEQKTSRRGDMSTFSKDEGKKKTGRFPKMSWKINTVFYTDTWNLRHHQECD